MDRVNPGGDDRQPARRRPAPPPTGPRSGGASRRATGGGGSAAARSGARRGAKRNELRWAIGTVLLGAVLLLTCGAQAAGIISPPRILGAGGASDGSATPAAVVMATRSPTLVPTPPSPTASPTPEPPTATSTVTSTPTVEPTQTPTVTPTPSATTSPTPTGTPTQSATPTPNVQKLSSAQVTEILRQQIEKQRAQFQDARVRFAPPNKIIVEGRTSLRGVPVPVQAELTLGVDPAGKPKIVSHKLSAGLLPVPPEGHAALAARVGAANAEIASLLPPDQRVRRVWTTTEAAFAEVE